MAFFLAQERTKERLVFFHLLLAGGYFPAWFCWELSGSSGLFFPTVAACHCSVRQGYLANEAELHCQLGDAVLLLKWALVCGADRLLLPRRSRI